MTTDYADYTDKITKNSAFSAHSVVLKLTTDYTDKTDKFAMNSAFSAHSVVLKLTTEYADNTDKIAKNFRFLSPFRSFKKRLRSILKILISLLKSSAFSAHSVVLKK